MIGLRILIFVFLLYLGGEIIESFMGFIGARKFGASKRAGWGAFWGGIIGTIVGFMFGGIGAIFGVFIGIFLGAFLAELREKKNLEASFKAGTGGLVGKLSSVIVKGVIGLAMLALLFFEIYT